MFVNPHELSITVTSGTGSEVVHFKHEVLKQVIVVPPSASAAYDVSLTNPRNIGKFDELDAEGTLNESVDLLVRDTHTFTISNASADGTYTVSLISYEPHG
jgi:hypothetical protein